MAAIHAASTKIYFYKIASYIKKTGQINQKRLKTHLYAPISQKLLSKSKTQSINATHEQKTSLVQKNLVHAAILLILTIRDIYEKIQAISLLWHFGH